jgi:hypothetical protein
MCLKLLEILTQQFWLSQSALSILLHCHNPAEYTNKFWQLFLHIKFNTLRIGIFSSIFITNH